MALLAASASAGYENKFVTDWQGSLDEVMASANCNYGPVNCGGELCMEGYACLHTVFASVCDDVAQKQCKKKCPKGETQSPLRYCECIPEVERDQMFCAADFNFNEYDDFYCEAVVRRWEQYLFNL